MTLLILLMLGIVLGVVLGIFAVPGTVFLGAAGTYALVCVGVSEVVRHHGNARQR